MGTVGYMSPEQVRGQAVDHRTDIFAFGAILYEMLSGKRAFHGQSAADAMSAVLKEDPPELSDTNKTVSPALERLVNHCLEKNHEARFQSARDLAFALESLPGSSANSADKTLTAVQAVPPRSWTTGRWPWIVSTVLALLLIATLPFAIMYFRRPATATTPEVLAISHSFAGQVSNHRTPCRFPGRPALGVSPQWEDGKEIIWIRAWTHLTRGRSMERREATQPFWSPDSRSIGFFADGKLKRIDVDGWTGPGTLRCTQPTIKEGHGAATESSSSLKAPQTDFTAYRRWAEVLRVTEVDVSRNELSTRVALLSARRPPLPLPRAKHAPEYSAIYVGSLDSKETKQLMQAHSSVAFAPPEYLLFVREDTLMAQGFDAERLELRASSSLFRNRRRATP